MKAVQLPKDKSVKVEPSVFTHEEIQKLVSAAKDSISLNFIFVFAEFTGMREGEILALTYGDIDMVGSIIHVNKTINFLKIDGVYQPLVTKPKTPESIRDIPIFNDIKPLLAAYIANEKEKHLRLGIPFSKDSILFSSVAGTYIEASNLRKRLKRLLNKLGIPQRNFHMLRHTFCSLLSEMGVPLKTASELMGHSDIAITAKTYTHTGMDEKKRAMSALSGVFDLHIFNT